MYTHVYLFIYLFKTYRAIKCANNPHEILKKQNAHKINLSL